MDHFYQNVPGFFTFPNVYSQMVKKFDQAHFVEVGSWKGCSACFMAVEIINSGKQIKFDCVDTWTGSREHQQDPDILKSGNVRDIFTRNIAPVSHVINIIDLPSVKAANLYLDKSLDFVFIDANHDWPYPKQDIIAWFPKIRTGGILAGHDIHHPDISRAVNEFFYTKDLNYYDDSWIVEIKSDLTILPTAFDI